MNLTKSESYPRIVIHGRENVLLRLSALPCGIRQAHFGALKEIGIAILFDPALAESQVQEITSASKKWDATIYHASNLNQPQSWIIRDCFLTGCERLEQGAITCNLLYHWFDER